MDGDVTHPNHLPETFGGILQKTVVGMWVLVPQFPSWPHAFGPCSFTDVDTPPYAG